MTEFLPQKDMGLFYIFNSLYLLVSLGIINLLVSSLIEKQIIIIKMVKYARY